MLVFQYLLLPNTETFSRYSSGDGLLLGVLIYLRLQGTSYSESSSEPQANGLTYFLCFSYTNFLNSSIGYA